jgi:hypothetical protein
MTAFVSPERARTASLTGVVGLLILAIAVVMMVIAAPAQVQVQVQVHYGAHNSAKPSAVQLTTDPCHQLTSRSDSTTAYACLVGPWAKEHVSVF